MNKKLIRCLGNEVLSIFELSKTMGDQKKEEFEFVRDQTESLRMIPLSKVHTPSIFNRQKLSQEVVTNNIFEEQEAECSEEFKEDYVVAEKEKKKQIISGRSRSKQIPYNVQEGNLKREDQQYQKQFKLRKGIPSIEDNITINYSRISIEEKKKKNELEQSNNNSHCNHSYSSEIVFCQEVEDPCATDIPSEQLAQEKGIQLQSTTQKKAHVIGSCKAILNLKELQKNERESCENSKRIQIQCQQ